MAVIPVRGPVEFDSLRIVLWMFPVIDPRLLRNSLPSCELVAVASKIECIIVITVPSVFRWVVEAKRLWVLNFFGVWRESAVA